MIFRTKPCQSYLGFREGWKWNEVVTRWKSHVQETNCTRNKLSNKLSNKSSQENTFRCKIPCSFLKASKAEWFTQCIYVNSTFWNSHPKQKETPTFVIQFWPGTCGSLMADTAAESMASINATRKSCASACHKNCQSTEIIQYNVFHLREDVFRWSLKRGPGGVGHMGWYVVV